MSLLWLPARISTGLTFLSLVILSIPLAFDVGGRDCGLTYSLALAAFYFVLSTIRLAIPTTQRWRNARTIMSVVEVLQNVIVIPGFLIYALNKFSDEDIVEEVVGVKTTAAFGGTTIVDREGMDRFTIGPWDNFLTFSTPMFQLAEGFCSLLVIQAGGQISRWLVNRTKSDTWMISLLAIDHRRLSILHGLNSPLQHVLELICLLHPGSEDIASSSSLGNPSIIRRRVELNVDLLVGGVGSESIRMDEQK